MTSMTLTLGTTNTPQFSQRSWEKQGTLEKKEMRE